MKNNQPWKKGEETQPRKLLSLPPSFQNFLSNIDWDCVKSVLSAFLITRIMVVVITYFSLALIPPSSAMNWFERLIPGNLVLDGLIRWDSIHFLTIAKDGYENQSLFLLLPMYPLLIRFTFSLIRNFYLSALFIPNLSFLISLFYLYLFTKEEFDKSTASRAVFYLASAPTAFFFSAAYTESIALMFIMMCFYYSKKEKWLIAGLAGALASATKIQCVFLSIFILFEAFSRNNIRFVPKPWNLASQLALLKKNLHEVHRMLNGIFASALSLTGIVGFMIFTYFKTGDLFFYFHLNQNSGRAFSWDWPIKLVQTIFSSHKITGSFLAGEIDNLWYLFDSFTIFVFLPLVIMVILKFRPSLSIFTVLCFLMPLTGLKTYGMQRFVLMLVPCFILLAIWGKRIWVDRVIVGIFLPLQAFFLILFSHWYWAG